MITATVEGRLMECYNRPGKDRDGNPITESVSVLYVNGGSAISVNACDLSKEHEIGDTVQVLVDIFNGKKDLFIRKTRQRSI